MTATTVRRRIALVLAVLAFAAAFGFAATAGAAQAKVGAARAGETSSSGRHLAGNAAAIDSAGRIVVAGTVFDRSSGDGIELARYKPDGSLDKSFGSGGTVTTYHLGDDPANAIAIDPSGRILVVGGVESFVVTRYEPDGSLDESFGTGGTVTTKFFDDEDRAHGVAIDASGMIVVAGGDCPSSTADCNPRFALARYDPDGSLDPTFGDGGKQLLGGCAGTLGAGMSANAVAIDPAGRIVLAGSCSVSTFALARYNSDGSLDPTFGSDGFVTTQFAGGSGAGGAFGIAIDPSGRIVAAGFAFPGFALARYNSDGSLDPTFGSGGEVTTGFGAAGSTFAKGVAIDGSGDIVAAGGDGTDFALARYTPSGALDPTFGSGGQVTTSFGTVGSVANAIAIDSAGRAIAVGSVGSGRTYGLLGGRGFALARYTPGGALDPTFGSGGLVTTLRPTTAIAKAKIRARKRTATFTFEATGPWTGLQCAFRPSRSRQPKFRTCRSPKTYRRLSPGHYTFKVRAVGPGGRDLSPAKQKFRIPPPPKTKIAKARINSQKRNARFNFHAIGKATGFQCELRRPHAKGKPEFKRCRSPKSYRHLRPGRYAFAVRAVGAGGRDPSPATRKFRIG